MKNAGLPPTGLRRIGQIDLDTGEVMEHATMAVVLKRARSPFGKRWFAMAQDPLEDLACRGPEIGFQATRVLLLMLNALDFDNEVVLSTGQAARKLGMTSSNVSRATKKLVELGILREGARLGSMKSYVLNPKYGWKGKGSDHAKALLGGGK